MPDEMLFSGTLTKACSQKRSQGLENRQEETVWLSGQRVRVTRRENCLFVRGSEGIGRWRRAQSKGACAMSTKGEEGRCWRGKVVGRVCN